nr:ATP-binding protein [Gemmatimonadota bacterium]
YLLLCDDPNCSVYADPDKMQQILLNLLSNAVKFTAPGGRIILGCESVGENVGIIVRDTGIGIDPSKLDTIFEPFIQLDRHTTSQHEGTGLGLSISRDLARAMRGDLTVASQVGIGSVFTLVLPTQPLVQPTPPAASRVPPSAGE